MAESYTYSQAETAMVLMDALYSAAKAPQTEASRHMAEFSENGFAAVREFCLAIAPSVENQWCLLSEAQQDAISWDMEWIPGVLQLLFRDSANPLGESNGQT